MLDDMNLWVHVMSDACTEMPYSLTRPLSFALHIPVICWGNHFISPWTYIHVVWPVFSVPVCLFVCLSCMLSFIVVDIIYWSPVLLISMLYM